MNVSRPYARDERKIIIKGWRTIKETALRCMDSLFMQEEFCICLDDHPKLTHTVKSKNYCRFMEHLSWYGKDVFYFVGIKNTINKWTVGNSGRYMHEETDFLPYPILLIKHYHECRMFVGLSMEKHLVLFTITQGYPKEICHLDQLFNVHHVAVIQETGEIVAAGIGFIKRYAIAGILHTSTVTQTEDIKMTLEEEEWVLNLRVETKSHCLFVVVESGINIIDYRTWTEISRLMDPEHGTMTCGCTSAKNAYIITGSRYGYIKVWTTALKILMHTFHDHRDCITAIVCHETQPLIFTSALDGWVLIYRLDTFSKVKVGGPITSLKMTTQSNSDKNSVGFWCRVNQTIKFYEMEEPYFYFCCMDSTVVRLKRLLGQNEYPNRVLVSTADGAVFFKNPVTAETVGFMFPILSIEIMTKYVYDVFRQRLYILLSTGAVISLNCDKNPFRAHELLAPHSPDEAVVCFVDVLLSIGTEENCFESIAVLIGMRNGQIGLLEFSSFYMHFPVKAHNGRVECLQTLKHLMPGNESTYSTNSVLLSAGSDMLIKLWGLRLQAEEGRGFQLQLVNIMVIRCEKLPKFLSGVEDKIAVTFADDSVLAMYDIGQFSFEWSNTKLTTRSQQPWQILTHTPDYDHTGKITALDNCPLLKIFATSSLDRTVKIWDEYNQLIRELEFDEPVTEICFVTDVGDILIAREYIVVYSPPYKYLPWSYLQQMIPKNYAEDQIEEPKPIVNSKRAWIDPEHVPRRRPTRSRRLNFTPSTIRDSTHGMQSFVLVWNDAFGTPRKISRPTKFHQRRRDRNLNVILESRSNSGCVQFVKQRKRLSIMPGDRSQQLVRSLEIPLETVFDDPEKTVAREARGFSFGRDSLPVSVLPFNKMAISVRFSASQTDLESLESEASDYENVGEDVSATPRKLLIPTPSDEALGKAPKGIGDQMPSAEGDPFQSGHYKSTEMSPAAKLFRIVKKGREIAAKCGLVEKPVRSSQKENISLKKSLSEVKKGDTSSPTAKEGKSGSFEDKSGKVPAKFDILRSPHRRLTVEDQDVSLISGVSPATKKSASTLRWESLLPLTERLRRVTSLNWDLRHSEMTHILDKRFKEYCESLGCGPIGPLLPLPPEEVNNAEISYATEADLKWYARRNRIPYIPNSVYRRTKKTRPPPPPTDEEKRILRAGKILDKLKERRPPLFERKPRQLTSADLAGQDDVKKKRRRRGKKKKKEPECLWNTLEEFAFIRKELLPVFSTRLWPRTDSELTFIERLLAERRKAREEEILAEGKELEEIVAEEIEESLRESRSESGSSQEFILSVELLSCLSEAWFPDNVPRTPVAIFKTLLGLLIPRTQAAVVLQVIDYVGQIMAIHDLTEDLRELARYKFLTLASHDNINIRTLVVSYFPIMWPINRAVLRIIDKSLKSDNEDLRKAAVVALNGYGIRSKHHYINILREYHLLQRGKGQKDELRALAIAEQNLLKKRRAGHIVKEHLDWYEALFTYSCGGQTLRPRMPPSLAPPSVIGTPSVSLVHTGSGFPGFRSEQIMGQKYSKKKKSKFGGRAQKTSSASPGGKTRAISLQETFKDGSPKRGKRSESAESTLRPTASQPAPSSRRSETSSSVSPRRRKRQKQAIDQVEFDDSKNLEPEGPPPSVSRTSLHFISTAEEESGDEVLSDSSPKYALPPRTKAVLRRKRSYRKKSGKKSKLPKPKEELEKLEKNRQLETSGYYWIPGEPGLRVLCRTVAETQGSHTRQWATAHQVEPLEGRMGAVTTKLTSGESHYGRLRLDWTTQVPALPVVGMSQFLRQDAQSPGPQSQQLSNSTKIPSMSCFLVACKDKMFNRTYYNRHCTGLPFVKTK